MSATLPHLDPEQRPYVGLDAIADSIRPDEPTPEQIVERYRRLIIARSDFERAFIEYASLGGIRMSVKRLRGLLAREEEQAKQVLIEALKVGR